MLVQIAGLVRCKGTLQRALTVQIASVKLKMTDSITPLLSSSFLL